MWERRYQAVQPVRSEANRRLYSLRDIEKLSLLHTAISSGHSIGRIAALPLEDLRRMLAAEAPPPPGATPAKQQAAAENFFDKCLEAVKQLDQQTFESELQRAGMALGQVALMEKIIAPLLDRVGELWRSGDLRIGHEHMASAVIRSTLGAMGEGFENPGAGPRMIVTTPTRNLHEFGALLAANTASSAGWRVAYLGPNLPAPEIAGAALDVGSKAIALSLVYPAGDATVSAELKELRRRVGNDIAIIAGGRASSSYGDILHEIGAVHIEQLAVFRTELDRILRGGPQKPFAG